MLSNFATVRKYHRQQTQDRRTWLPSIYRICITRRAVKTKVLAAVDHWLKTTDKTSQPRVTNDLLMSRYTYTHAEWVCLAAVDEACSSVVARPSELPLVAANIATATMYANIAASDWLMMPLTTTRNTVDDQQQAQLLQRDRATPGVHDRSKAVLNYGRPLASIGYCREVRWRSSAVNEVKRLVSRYISIY